MTPLKTKQSKVNWRQIDEPHLPTSSSRTLPPAHPGLAAARADSGGPRGSGRRLPPACSLPCADYRAPAACTPHQAGPAMIRPALVQMFLSSAYLCPECSTVSNDSSGCPRGCGPVLSLAGVLDRQRTKEPVPAVSYRHAKPETIHARTH